MAYSAVALLAFFAAFHNADGVLGGDSMATASSSERTLVDEPMMMAPEPEFDLATSRARVNQDPATLTRAELRYGNYLPLLGRGRRLLDSEEAAAAPAPAEDEEGTLELATERGFRLGGQAGMNFGTGTPFPQTNPLTGRLTFGRRRQLLGEEMESEMMMMAPAPEVDLATERGRIGGRTGFNFGTGTLYTQNRFD
ncbi:hypothetical protein PPROV_000425500 [Pycnococcus provasolii]|uniref:Uncharacterized protein n=1 Tax=Pycnococcus provasolii TaxID=41880 RepID=A0A830HES7_9CHLO|nr:hypothetical protein PPROV_000425500 [Pycnococcus provasolii]